MGKEISTATLWMHGALQAGREFLYSIEVAIVTPMLKILHLSDEGTSWIWSISAICGLLLGPVIGHCSDNCTSTWGRRRPFIIALAIASAVGLTLQTFALDIYTLQPNTSIALAVALIGSQLMDWAMDTLSTPCKAYTLDTVIDADRQTTALVIQLFLIGLGGAAGFLTVALCGIEHRAILYGVGLTVLISTLLLTVFSIKETPCPRQYTSHSERDTLPIGAISVGTSFRSIDQSSRLSRRLSRRSLGSFSTILSRDDLRNIRISCGHIFSSIFTMPKELLFLALCELSQVFVDCTVLLYYTDFVGTVCFNGDAKAAPNSTMYQNYADGLRVGSFGLIEMAITMSIICFFLEQFDLIKVLGIKAIYIFSFAVLTLTSLFIFLFPNWIVALSLVWLYGISFGINDLVPFVLLSRYHTSRSFRKQSPNGTERCFGLDCAIIVCQQYMAQLLMSWIVGPVIAAYNSPVIIFAISSIVATIGLLLSSFFVTYEIN